MPAAGRARANVASARERNAPGRDGWATKSAGSRSSNRGGDASAQPSHSDGHRSGTLGELVHETSSLGGDSVHAKHKTAGP